MKVYCVYKHTSPNGKVYIGITSVNPIDRWANGNGYRHNLYFTSAIKKYGWENIKHEILCENLHKEEAEQKEIELIMLYKSNQKEFGYNIENGGNHHGKHSEKTKQKISESHIGMKYDDNFSKRMSELKKGNKNRLGKKLSEYSKGKISEKNKGKLLGDKNYFYGKRFRGACNPRAIAISQYDLNGVFIKTLESANLFATELGVRNASHVIQCCKGKRNSAYGFKWKYAKEVV